MKIFSQTIVLVSICQLAQLDAANKPVAATKSPAKTAPASGGKHCLWRVKNGNSTVYLVGAIYSLRASDYPIATVFDNAIAESRQFFFEYDVNLEQLFVEKMRSAVRYQNGVQIKDKVRPETYRHLIKITQSNFGSWQHLKPWAIAVYVLRYPGLQQVSSSLGMDNYVFNKARQKKGTFKGLESVDEHVNVFGGMNDKESEALLLEALVFADLEAKTFPELVAAWKRGDVQRLYSIVRLFMPDLVDAPHLKARLLTNRHPGWLPKIETALKSGETTMVVVGAAHFGGPGNILSMLRARGYQIEQL